MAWSYSRIDRLPPQAHCIFCNRPLSKASGIIIQDEFGAEAHAGPACAKRHLGDSDERLIDISRIALQVVVPAKPPSRKPVLPPPPQAPNSDPKSGDDEPPRKPPLPPLDKVIVYLRLRCEFMDDFKFRSSALLRDAYEHLKSDGVLPEIERKKVAGIMRNSELENSVFSDRNVRACLAFDFWIKEAMAHTGAHRQEFLKAMLAKLHTWWQLSENQISGINKWGEKLRSEVDDFPLLDTTSFSNVTTPDFMVHRKKKG